MESLGRLKSNSDSFMMIEFYGILIETAKLIIS
jgi:hypothetical protein